MPSSSDLNNRSEWNESMKENIDARGTFCSIIKDEVIVSDDYIDVCTIDKDSFESSNHIGEIANITNNSGEAYRESFVEIYGSDPNKTVSNNSTINHVYNDKKSSKYSQLCLNCGITLNESMKRIELCKATKSFTCSACSFKCCSKNNLKYHMQNDHKISSNYAVTSDSKEKEMTESMNNSLNKRYRRIILKIDTERDIEAYCEKCNNTSRPLTNHIRTTCRVCGASAFYQCKICKKRYIHTYSMYRHLNNECINVEPQYKCNQCDYKSKQKSNLTKHVQLKHSIKKCTQCDTIFKDFFALRKHQLNKCVNGANLKCNYCSYKTIFKTLLMKHIRFEHNSRYTCSQCGKKYIQLKSFNKHQKNGCGSEIRYECNYCSYSANYKSHLKRHIRSLHSEIF